jgi:hypothetical protein
MRKALGEAYGGDRFAFAGCGWGSRGDNDQLAAPLERGIGKKFETNFAAFRANLLEILIGKFEFARYFANREKCVGHERCGLLGAKETSAGEKIITGSLHDSKTMSCGIPFLHAVGPNNAQFHANREVCDGTNRRF